MARDHTPEKKAQPQIIEREINLALINDKLNSVIGLCLDIAKKTGVKVKVEEEDEEED